jgi:hypothetical protein
LSDLVYYVNEQPKYWAVKINNCFLQQTDHKHDLGLNLCHTTGITSDSEPVLIKINVVKHIQCDVCKTGLCMSQLISLHQVTHGLGKLQQGQI